MPVGDGQTIPSAKASLPPLSGFRTDIQALRGVAVLAVVIFHTGVALPGGYVGVDVFFVISGFVIARLVVREFHETDAFSFRRFYLRRAHRLLPALAVLLLFVLLLSPMLAPAGGQQAQLTAAAAALFVANGYLFAQDGYFATAAELNPLLHTWSLSVEEQFYFVFPALLALAWSVGRRRLAPVAYIRGLVLLVAAISLAASLLFSYSGQVGPLPGLRFAFFSPLTRTWEFAAGVALALLPVRWLGGPLLRRSAVIAGSLILAYSMLAFSEHTTFPGLAALVPVGGTMMLIYGGTTLDPDNIKSSRQVGLNTLSRLGDLSYSWYLWHWPLIVFALAYWPRSGALPAIAAGVLSLLPAWLSYRFVEQPMRRVPADLTKRRPIVLASACVTAPLLVVALSSPLSAPIASNPWVDSFTRAQAFHLDLLSGCDNTVALGERPDDLCVWAGKEAKASVVLVGDSQAGQFSETIVEAGEAVDAEVRIATASACPFIDASYEAPGRDTEACRSFVEGTMRSLVAAPPDAVVIGITDGYYRDSNSTLVDERTGRRSGDPDVRATIFEAALARQISRLRAVGSEVVVLGAIPKPLEDWDPNRCGSLAIMTDVNRCTFLSFEAKSSDRFLQANAMLRGAAARSGAVVWDFTGQLCPDGTCRATKGIDMLWRDAEHISVDAAEALVPTAKKLMMAEPVGNPIGSKPDEG